MYTQFLEENCEFSGGRDDNYDNVITNILSMEPLSSLNRAFSLAQQIEMQKHISAH